MGIRKCILTAVGLYAWIAAAAFMPADSIPIDTVLLDDGSLYMGQIRDSLFNGEGICIYPDGTVYQGGWTNGLRNGQGILVYPDGDIYKGSFRNHIKEGKGTYVYRSGARYDGEWKDDMFNGSGKLRFEDGGYYDGAWKNDMKHGYGRLQTYYGQSFTGYFYNDEFLGLPFDTEIDQDSTLTDELKEWGFRHETPHAHVYFAPGISFGSKGMATVSLFMDIPENHFYWGLSVGLNIEPPTRGRKTGMGWYMIEDDIHMVGEYISSEYMLEGGLKLGNWAMGGSVGLGISNVYMNCRANNTNPDTYFSYWMIKYGDSYCRDGANCQQLVYRGILRYSIPIKKIPKATMYFGYGNADGLFIGVGGYM